MLRIDDGCDAAVFLRLGDGVNGKRSLTGTFRTINLNDTTFGVTADTQGMVQCDGTAGNHLRGIPFGLVSQFHDGTLAVILLNFVNGCLECLETGCSLRCVNCFFCHNLTNLVRDVL